MIEIKDDDRVFAMCGRINQMMDEGRENDARTALIEMLDWHARAQITYTPILNHFIRKLGLFPYLDVSTSSWEDAFAFESFQVDVGGSQPAVLHREQSRVLRRLLEGESLALSAPTSFGKSFVIDSFIAIARPKNVLIIVPTLALADETRRRLLRKFGAEYKIVTSVASEDVTGAAIYILPQERALSYIDRIGTLDLLVVDEFYKASANFDRERSASLIRAIVAFSAKAAQKYYLAPNISSLAPNPFTDDMEFVHLDYNTVVLRTHSLFESIGGNAERKAHALLEVLCRRDEKTLVYVGTYSGINEVVSIVMDRLPRLADRRLLLEFEEWLIVSYGGTWEVPGMISRGFGIHNGQLHRPLSQLQIRVFDEDDGIQGLVSTSSMIEGVNTSAQNVVLWKNKNGAQKLTDFEYRNIMGRSGRMFRHFVGEVYVLERPPESGDTQLSLALQDSLLGLSDIQNSNFDFDDRQQQGVSEFRSKLRDVTRGSVSSLDGVRLQTSDSDLILKIFSELTNNPSNWAGLGYLNSASASDWDFTLFKVLELGGGVWDTTYTKFVNFIKMYSSIWDRGVAQLRHDLSSVDLGIDLMFKLERNLSYKFSSLLGDINVINRTINPSAADVSSFVFKTSNAFLPPVVYGLEEYGLPRMLARKMQDAGFIDFENADLTLDAAIRHLINIKGEIYLRWFSSALAFDRYVLDYFYEGITPHNN